jgi:transposase
MWVKFVRRYLSLHSKRQVVELPPVVPIYEEYRQYVCQCVHCSHEQKADFPVGVNAPIQYGSSVAALTSYFSVYQYIPFYRLQSLFRQVFSLPLSQGSIGNMLAKTSTQCEVVFEAIQTDIAQSKVVGSDETGDKVNGTKWWVWVWQTVLNTLIVATDNRGCKSIASVWEQGLQNAVLISDRWAAQLKMQVKGHQICLAHLLRDLNFLVESEKHAFATDFHTLLTEVFALKKVLLRNKQALLPTDTQAIDLEQRLNALLLIPLDKASHPQTLTFQASMLKYRNYLFPCLYDLDIPPDNNASERAIRNIKVKQKVSGQFKSGQNYFCRIRSVIDTLLKRNIPILATLQQICKLEVK